MWLTIVLILDVSKWHRGNFLSSSTSTSQANIINISQRQESDRYKQQTWQMNYLKVLIPWQWDKQPSNSSAIKLQIFQNELA